MADPDPLVVRGAEVPVVQEWTEVDRIRQRLDENKARLRAAMDAMEAAARELTPAARIRHDPGRWIGGAFLVGLVLGFFTGRSR
jgi:ElaB/YqjD/DUF883 family membrane-anchored ribosome-binding protein